MKLFKWLPGRQERTTYKKYCFLFTKIGRIGIDGYILKYRPFTILRAHRDQLENGKHYRLNIVLKGNGYFICNKCILNIADRIILFRPDKEMHAMYNGPDERKVLSIGVGIYEKKQMDRSK